MPYYTFINQDTQDVTDLFYHMSDAPKIGETVEDEDGKYWKRIATIPCASIDTQIDPFSSKDFVKVTNKPGTLGQMFDLSKEMSERRAEKAGIDPVLAKYEAKQEKETGVVPFAKRQREANKKLSELGVSVKMKPREVKPRKDA